MRPRLTWTFHTVCPAHDLLGVTVILLSCFYRDREFIRVGYYVNSEYDSQELNENPPEQPIYERIIRNVSLSMRVQAHALALSQARCSAAMPLT